MKKRLKKGLVQVYTGNGKGKTTAALGAALRALGAGLSVYVGQFLKKGDYCEMKALRRFGKAARVEQFGSGCFVRGKASARDMKYAANGLKAARRALESGAYDLVILDEISVAMFFGLVTAAEVADLVAGRRPHIEVIMTGRRFPLKLRRICDLVTEMKEIKHYYRAGVKPRRGIEH